jgi:hypothetical protein
MSGKYEKVGLAVWKFAENILSVKVWVIFGFMFLSTYLLTKVQGGITADAFAAWATGNGSIIATVLAIREGVKVRKITAASNGATEDQVKEIQKIMT